MSTQLKPDALENISPGKIWGSAWDISVDLRNNYTEINIPFNILWVFDLKPASGQPNKVYDPNSPWYGTWEFTGVENEFTVNIPNVVVYIVRMINDNWFIVFSTIGELVHIGRRRIYIG